jgi:hypothetical protein
MTDFFKKRDDVWDAYLGELERNVGPSTDLSLLQPYRASRGFPVDAVKYPKFSNFLANQEANSVTDFSATSNHPIYTNARLTERYSRFLADLSRTVAWKDMTDAEKIREQTLNTEKDDRRRDLEVFEDRVDARWLSYKTAHGIPSDGNEWLARQRWESHYGYIQDRTTLRDKLFDAISKHWLFLQSVIPPGQAALRTAIEYWQNTSYEESFPPSTAYESETSHDHWGRFKSQTLQMNYDDFFKNDSKRSLTIEETTKQSETRKNNWNASGGYSLGFISVGGSGGGSSDETHIRENTEKIEISWQRLEEVPIFRAPWFQPVLFTTYGTLVKGYWGPGGLLSCFPTHVVVARGLKISLYIKEMAKDVFNRVVAGSGDVRIGPWSIGGGGGSEEHTEKFSEKSFGYLIEDSTSTARILAVRVERPNYSSVAPNDFRALVEDNFSRVAQHV